MRVGIAYHDKYRQYDFGPGHPFRGDRFDNALTFFRAHGLLDRPDVTLLTPDIAQFTDLRRVHDKPYLDLIFDNAAKNRAYDFDTPLSPRILEGALYIMGGAVTIGHALSTGTITRGILLGGGLHHAGTNFGGGFCLFNDVAIHARYLQQEHGLKRVLILDYDVHGGNGTSDIFYADPTVLVISIHQDPRTLYPGTGFVPQIGTGPGTGYNVNVPLPPGTGTATYLHAVNETFIPLARAFHPDVILANGGSDPHFADSLGSLNLTVPGFFQLATLITATADQLSHGNVALHIGSGYNPAVLPACWYALAAGVAGLPTLDATDPAPPPTEPPYCRPRVDTLLQELHHTLAPYWTCFK